MVRALFDTCILIDYLNGIELAKVEFDRFDQKTISVITWMEVMVGVDADKASLVEQWLASSFNLISVTDSVSKTAVKVRRELKVKLPDAIIYASALENDMLFVTRNTKDFNHENPTVRVPYQLKSK